ncbi:ATP-dependent DNA helicase PIF1, partial [Glycine soja]
MLTACKETTSFEDIRTVTNIQYPTYREACFAMGFLQDDREFVEATKEENDWGTTNYLRKLFVLMLLTGAINNPEEVWNQTWHWLADGIEYHYSKSTINTNEQTSIYNQIIEVVNKNQGGMFFLYGFGGTRKTFIWRTLETSLRANNQIVIIVASNGIASLLLPGSRTAHSKFKIPVPIFKDSTCNIHQGSELTELLNQTSLIIWDEAPMAHKFCFEALDQCLRDISKTKPSSNQIFGGKVMVFGGDFRQILSVIPRGSRSINSSYLWDCCQVLRLTKNMCLQNNVQSPDEQETVAFAKWILDIGDRIIGHENDGYSTIEIPEDLLIIEYDDPIHAIVNSTFPDLSQHHNDPQFFNSRAILASTNETVEQVNDYILSLIPVTPIMLLRNLDQTQGLCNGTRLIITRLAKHVIAAEIISGKNSGHMVYIPRMSMSPPQSPWPFKLLRRQFPIMLSYAMTINKSQGQSLSTVGLYFPKPVFSHGQLYVALSRVKTKKGLKILIHDKDQTNMTSTTNVVFKEVFNNLTSYTFSPTTASVRHFFSKQRFFSGHLLLLRFRKK